MRRSSRQIRKAVVLVAAAAVGVVVACGAANAASAPVVKALVGGTLVDGTGSAPVKDAVVVIREGRIACAGTRRACPVPAGAEVLDVKDSWVMPGLIDAHVHLSQSGWVDSHPDSLDVRDRYSYEQVQADLRAHPEPFLRSFLCSGVTAVFDMGGYTWIWDLRSRTAANPDAPHVAAVGPLLSVRDYWLNQPAERQFITMTDEKTVRADVRYLAANRTDAVEVWLAPTKDQRSEEVFVKVRAAGDEAHRFGLPLIADATVLRAAKDALQAGANVLAHGVIDRPVDAEFIMLAKQNGTIYCPTLTLFSGFARLYEAVATRKPPVVDDPNGCVDATTRAHVAETASLGTGLVSSKRVEGSKAFLARTQASPAPTSRPSSQPESPWRWERTPGTRSPFMGPRYTPRWRRCRRAG